MTDRNIVLVTFDSLRADHCGHLGYDRDTTPALDAMAADGVTFENAIAPASRTNPSMAGTLTGEPMIVRDRVANEEHARHHLSRHDTIAERLSDRGYATGAFCPNAYASRYYGFDRGFDTFEDFLFDSEVYQSLFEKHLGDSGLVTLVRNLRNYVRKQEAFKTWDTYVDDIETWVHNQDGPFFLWAFSLDTHFPYLTPRQHRRWGSAFKMYYYNWRCNQLIDEFDVDLSEPEKQAIIDIYDDSIRFADRFIAELQERLADFDPVFVVHADHGEAFGERDIYGHFYPALYEENIHVPLVASEGGTASVDVPASLLDLPELITGFADDPDYDPTTITRDWVYATDYDGRNDRNLLAIRTRDWKYLATESNGHIDRELYDLSGRTVEEQNLVGEHREVEKPLRMLGDRRRHHETELLKLTGAASSFADWETESPDMENTLPL